MSASLCGNMRGSQVKTSLLLLLLLLTTSSTGTEEDQTEATETTPETNGPALTSTLQPSSTESESSGQGEETEGVSGVYGEDPPENETSTDSADEEDDGSFTITLIIVVVAVVILGMIVGGISFFCQRNKRAINQELSKEDPYLDGSSTEKVPMPMFEEDVPSVQELEMEELDQWMKKDNSPTAS